MPTTDEMKATVEALRRGAQRRRRRRGRRAVRRRCVVADPVDRPADDGPRRRARLLRRHPPGCRGFETCAHGSGPCCRAPGPRCRCAPCTTMGDSTFAIDIIDVFTFDDDGLDREMRPTGPPRTSDRSRVGPVILIGRRSCVGGAPHRLVRLARVAAPGATERARRHPPARHSAQRRGLVRRPEARQRAPWVSVAVRSIACGLGVAVHRSGPIGSAVWWCRGGPGVVGLRAPAGRASAEAHRVAPRSSRTGHVSGQPRPRIRSTAISMRHPVLTLTRLAVAGRVAGDGRGDPFRVGR